MQAHLKATSKSNIFRLLSLKKQIPLQTRICPHKTKRPKAQCHYSTKKTEYLSCARAEALNHVAHRLTYNLATSGKPNIEQE